MTALPGEYGEVGERMAFDDARAKAATWHIDYSSPAPRLRK
jgi:hypothetical protein